MNVQQDNTNIGLKVPARVGQFSKKTDDGEKTGDRGWSGGNRKKPALGGGENEKIWQGETKSSAQKKLKSPEGIALVDLSLRL